MKNYLSLFVVFLLLTACTSKEPKPSLVGKWNLVVPPNSMGIDFISETVFHEGDSFANILYTIDSVYYDVRGTYVFEEDSSKVSLNSLGYTVVGNIRTLNEDSLVIEVLPSGKVSTFLRDKGFMKN